MARLVIAAVLAALLAGCAGPVLDPELIGSGNLVDRSYDLKGFSHIEANNMAQVEVTRGNVYNVSVQVDDNVDSRLTVSVKGDTLRIALKNADYQNVTLRVQVTMPELTEVTLNGASTLRAQLDGESLALNMVGANIATLTGTAGRVTIESGGASQALLGGLEAQEVEVNAKGASHIEVHTEGAVRGRAEGASVVLIGGSPASVDVQTDGVAQVINE